MTTFLEFVVSKVLGPPVRSRGNGESAWGWCIWCGNQRGKFHTRPDVPEFAHKLSCFACGRWGDEFDILKWGGMGRSYEERRDVILPALRAEFDALPKDGRPAGVQSSAGSAPDGRRAAAARVCPKCRAEEGEPGRHDVMAGACDAGGAVEELVEELDDLDAPGDDGGKRGHLSPDEAELALTAAVAALQLCHAHGLHPLAMAQAIGQTIYFERAEREHWAGCADRDCDHAVCLRRRNGWTPEEFAAYRERDRAARDAVRRG